ncbi:MAG: hypothetical protein ACK56I_32280, partial [bacterium]
LHDFGLFLERPGFRRRHILHSASLCRHRLSLCVGRDLYGVCLVPEVRCDDLGVCLNGVGLGVDGLLCLVAGAQAHQREGGEGDESGLAHHVLQLLLAAQRAKSP